MSAVPNIRLNNGVEIPQLGFGVFQIPPAETRAATLEALRVGYRHIDTAEMYGNEAEVAEGIRDSGIPRSEIFVTSKLNNGFHAHDAALKAFDRSLDLMKLEYLDLFLIHWPLPAVGDFVETWKAMEEIYASGRVKAIGVSNFQTHHLDRLARETRHRSGGQPDRDPSLLQPGRNCGPMTPPTASRPKPGRRSPRARSSTIRSWSQSLAVSAAAPPRSRSAGISSSATSSSRSRSRRPGSRRTSPSSISS